MAIAKGNTKLGTIPNISLLPGKTCVKGIPCAKAGQCYAMKFVKMYANVKTSWSANTKLALTDRPAYFETIRQFLAKNTPRHFRWHVSGDILDQSYLDSMVELANEFPQTRFLAFTKRHTLDYSARPANLSIVFSMWPGMPVPIAPKGIQIAWMKDDREDRIPAGSIECPGKCENCMMCWSLPEIGRDVYFHKH